MIYKPAQLSSNRRSIIRRAIVADIIKHGKKFGSNNFVSQILSTSKARAINKRLEYLQQSLQK